MIDHCKHAVDLPVDLVARARIGQVGLARGGVVAQGGRHQCGPSRDHGAGPPRLVGALIAGTKGNRERIIDGAVL